MNAKCFNTLLGVEGFTPQDWYLDSGASCHLTFNKEWFRDINSSNMENATITCANSQKLSVSGVGNILTKLNGDDVTFTGVKLVPDLCANLLSVSKVVEKGNVVVFGSTGCNIYNDQDCCISGTSVATASKVAGIYKLDSCVPIVDSALAVQVEKTAVKLWHRRLGHVNFQDMKRVPGLKFVGDMDKLESCESCIKGKMHRIPFDKDHEAVRATEKLGLVHMDLCGPMENKSYGGHSYFLIVVDDCTRKMFIYFLKSKTDVLDRFKMFVNEGETYSGKKIKIVRTDNGKEFVNAEFNAYLKSKGIKHQLSVPYTPQQNGVAERANRTVVEMARSMLADSGLNTKYWAEACHTAVYTKNHLPHSANGGAIPEKLWSGNDVDVNKFKVFGSRAFVHIPKELRKKWDYKGKEYIFVGYCDETKGYRFSDPNIPSRVIKSRDVVFLEETKEIEAKNEAISEKSKVLKNSTVNVLKPKRQKEENIVVWEFCEPKVTRRADLEEVETFEDTVEIQDSLTETEVVQPEPDSSGQENNLDVTADNIADALTKSLPKAKLGNFIDSLLG
ncbi:unnamed protein product [Diatraea saccharalis]|uniref:Integrase catalytic domain-containing protein n=1 Tax=Diatraea saccharalis TaxID=40085 RepID=A0A9N9R0M6_9NEOP|nr:unnamed protein product [Diatraea saccharalis]